MGGKETQPDQNRGLYKRIVQDFGSFAEWKQDFINTGLMRGIGWVVLYKDPAEGHLINMCIAEDQDNHMAGGDPILI